MNTPNPRDRAALAQMFPPGQIVTCASFPGTVGTVAFSPQGDYLRTNQHGMTAVHVSWPHGRRWHDPRGLVPMACTCPPDDMDPRCPVLVAVLGFLPDGA